MRPVVRDAVCGAFLFGAFAMAGVARADTLTIYRCVDAKGSVSLQDFACAKDMHQDVRQMIRPQDAPPPSVSKPAYARAQRPIEQQPLRVHEPKTLYECRTGDGQTYTNQTGIPGGRYVPMWTYAYGGGRQSSRPYVAAGSTYVRDTCVRMSTDSACQHLRDRREELDTEIFNAQADDRQRYQGELNSTINQLRNDCSGT